MAVWRWINKSRRRQVGCVVVILVLLAGWGWNDFCLARADANLVLRRHDAAEWWLERIRWGQPLNAERCLLELRLARRLRRFHEVEQLLNQAKSCGVRDADLRREQWLALAQTQQFDQVSSHWQELLSDPRDDEPEIARAYVVWASSRDQVDAALRVLELWSQDFPNDPEPHALRGQISAAMNYEAGAVDSYRKALALAPKNDEYRLALADALQKRLKLDEAANLYQQILHVRPGNRAAIRGLAATYTSLGEFSKAQLLLEWALTRFPDDLDLHRSMGEVCLAKGDDAAAATHLGPVHAAFPENADIAYSLAQALKATKRAQEAAPLFDFVAESREPLSRLKPLEEELAKRPNDLELRLQIASISAKYKSRREAIRWLEKLLLISPSYRPAHEALVELYRLTGDIQKAAEHQKTVDDLSQAGK